MAISASKKESEAIADGLHSAAIRLLRRVRKEDDKAGIPPGQLSALSVLVFGGAMRLTDLAAAEHVKPPTMTKIVAALETAGLVRRTADRTDARATVLEATARGQKLMQEGRRRRIERLAAGVGRLPREQRETLRRASEIVGRLAAEI